MKNYVYGFVSCLALFVFGFYFVLPGCVEYGMADSFEEHFAEIEDPEVALHFHTKDSVDTDEIFGLSAEGLSSYLAAGDLEKKELYYLLLESGFSISITIKDGDGAYTSLGFSEQEGGLFEVGTSSYSNVVIERDPDFLEEHFPEAAAELKQKTESEQDVVSDTD